MFSFLPGLAELLTRAGRNTRSRASGDRGARSRARRHREAGARARIRGHGRCRGCATTCSSPRWRRPSRAGCAPPCMSAPTRTCGWRLRPASNGIEHTARGLTDDTIALMAAKKITFTPTLVVLDWAWKRDVAQRRRSLTFAVSRCRRSCRSLLDPKSPLAPMLGEGEMSNTMAGAFAGSLQQTVEGDSRRRAGDRRIGRRQSGHVPRHLADPRARAARAGGHAVDRTC